MSEEIEILKDCIIEGTVIKLPPFQLSPQLYKKVAAKLQGIGGKWKGGKVQGFIFAEDPATRLKMICKGERYNVQQKFQTFFTPAKLAEELVKDADVKHWDTVLEPSAGQGALIKAIRGNHANIVHYCELMPENRKHVDLLPDVVFLRDNFLTLKHHETMIGIFDKIIANPPFTGNADIKHILTMWELLAPGGRIVTLASPHFKHSEGKTETRFKTFLSEVNASIETIPAGTFKESGTTIETIKIIIDK